MIATELNYTLFLKYNQNKILHKWLLCVKIQQNLVFTT